MRPGDLVVVRDESWMVARTECFECCTIVTLDGRGPGNWGRRFQAISPFDRISPSLPAPPRHRKRRAVLRRALGALAHERPALGLWTAAEARLDLFAYQLEPALAVLRGATRVLLADAVGLGKTIQAGLVLAELQARGLVDHALILCPAGLREAWALELRDRFGIDSAVLDHVAIDLDLRELAAQINPWAVHRVVVASIDFIKRPEVLAAVERVAFDLVVADEAHHLTPGSDRGQAVHRLAARAPWVILISATPHSGDQAAFDFLTAIGALDDSIAVFHRGRAEIGRTTNRRSRRIAVGPTAEESRLLDAIDAYARAIWQARGRSDHAVQLIAITLARRAASSAAALGQTLTRRRALLSSAGLPPLSQPPLPWDEVDDEDGDEPEQWLARPGLWDEVAERRHLDALIDLAGQAAIRSSKLARLRRLLTRAGEPAVVFSEYRDTLEAAGAELAPAFRLGAIHGGVAAPQRLAIVQQFDRGGIDVLLATDTAGEGLNLQRRCRLVIDLELPWNPRRLEQRVGRVDRLGQQRRVHALHLVHRGSVEDRVWQHLEQRRARAAAALADWDSPTAGDVARTIFGDDSPPPPAVAIPVPTRIDGADEELLRVCSLRRWRRHTGLVLHDTVFARPRRTRRSDLVAAALYEGTQLGQHGGLIERRAHAHIVSLRGMHTPAAWRAAVSVLREFEDGERPAAHLHTTRLGVLARISAIRRQLVTRSRLHQGLLFDPPATSAAGDRREVAARLDAALARRADSLSLADLHPLQMRLVAFWPLILKP